MAATKQTVSSGHKEPPVRRRAEKTVQDQGVTKENGATWRQLLMPMLTGMLTTRKALHEWVTELGVASIITLMEADAELLVGSKGKHQKDRAFYHWGAKDTPFPYAGREMILPRPRVRSVDKKKEVTLPIVEELQAVDLVAERVLDQVLLGVSMRGFDRSLGPAPKEVLTRATKKSRASELFIAETTKRMKAEVEQRLEGLDVIAVMLDGIYVADHNLVVAMGVTVDGKKHVLGVRLGSTENKALCVGLLQDLLGRGLRVVERTLFVVDGAKGLRWAISDVFGDLAVVQRCTGHKRRNVSAHLPKNRQRSVDRMLCEAYASMNLKTARRRLKQVISWLDSNGEVDAAASLREGMEETLTVVKLNLPIELRRFFATTNAIENLMGTVRRIGRNVTRWKDGKMIKRWVVIALTAAKDNFRRIKGHSHLRALADALRGNARVDILEAAV
jgi:putative transposase